MSRVLIVSPVPVEPPTAGNRARIATFVQALEDLGHEVTFMHVEREPGDADAMRASFGERYVPVAYRAPRSGGRRRRLLRRLGIPAGYRYPLDAWYDPATDRSLDELFAARAVDVVIVEYVFMSRALLRVPPGVIRIIDTHDVFTDRHRRYLDLGQAPHWFSCSRKDEAAALERADRVLAIQEREAAWFRELSDRPVTTVGHLVTVDALPDPPGERVLIVGSANPINVESTRWFLDTVAPPLRAARPGVELALAGTLCDAFAGCRGVTLLGRFDRAESVYRPARVVVNPMRLGTGLKIKTIEALGFGRATVTTTAGASGLEEAAGEALIVADDAAMAGAVAKLLADDDERVALAARAARFARSWNEHCLAALNVILAPTRGDAR